MIYKYFYVITFDNTSKCIIYATSISMTVVFPKVDGVYLNIASNACNLTLLNKRVDNVIRIRSISNDTFCTLFTKYIHVHDIKKDVNG